MIDTTLIWVGISFALGWMITAAIRDMLVGLIAIIIFWLTEK